MPISKRHSLVCLSLSLPTALFLLSLEPAYCQAERPTVDWSKVNLNAQQSKQIQELEKQWRHDYTQVQPALAEEQKKLARLLGEHDSEPVEIMALQTSIARKREQLSALAMANYLKKRQVLTETQQRTLEIMMRQAITEREQNSAGGTLSQTAPDHIQGLMQRVRNAWTVDEH